MIGLNAIQARAGETRQVTFYVLWYDIGKTALDRLKGVIKVEKGFKRLKDINRVFYDPALVDNEQMAESLKKEKTYIGTVPVKPWNLLKI